MKLFKKKNFSKRSSFLWFPEKLRITVFLLFGQLKVSCSFSNSRG